MYWPHFTCCNGACSQCGLGGTTYSSIMVVNVEDTPCECSQFFSICIDLGPHVTEDRCTLVVVVYQPHFTCCDGACRSQRGLGGTTYSSIMVVKVEATTCECSLFFSICIDIGSYITEDRCTHVVVVYLPHFMCCNGACRSQHGLGGTTYSSIMVVKVEATPC